MSQCSAEPKPGLNRVTGKQKTALVTGASSGFGYEFSLLLAEDGYDLAIVARRADRLDKLAQLIREKYARTVHVFAADLSENNAPEKLYQLINEKDLQIEVLINNAGVGSFGKFYQSNPRFDEEMINLNVLVLTSLTRLFVKDMIENHKGRILNVASLAAFQPGGPMMTVYYASKAYVLSFTRSLRSELKGTGVSVTALCPGPTKTEFGQSDHVQTTRMFKLASTSSRQVAEAGYSALKRNRSTVVPGLLNKVLAIGGELPPRAIAFQVNKFLLGGGNQATGNR